MGADQSDHGAWSHIKKMADRLDSPNADKIYVAKEYTKQQLRDDLLSTIPGWVILDPT